jgi:hypothetical protein
MLRPPAAMRNEAQSRCLSPNGERFVQCCAGAASTSSVPPSVWMSAPCHQSSSTTLRMPSAEPGRVAERRHPLQRIAITRVQPPHGGGVEVVVMIM